MRAGQTTIRGRSFRWGRRTYIMGVINVTPDSFSDGGRYLTARAAAARADLLVRRGADLLDVGGESSRPFSRPVPAQEELRRVIPAIRAIRETCQVPISIDTTKAVVAEEALKAGADIINDISALRFDPGMAEVARAFDAPLILMHMKGTPGDMQVNPSYADVLNEVSSFLKQRVAYALESGIKEERLIIDPGIGFGKRLEDNLVLLNRLDELEPRHLPVLVGPSRKAFIGHITGIEQPRERDTATLGAVAAAAMRGADIVRVHDVGPASQVLRVVDAIRSEAARAARRPVSA